MWCGRKQCLTRGQYAELLKKKRNQSNTKPTEGNGVSDEFKIALAAVTTPEDLGLIDSQYFQVKD